MVSKLVQNFTFCLNIYIYIVKIYFARIIFIYTSIGTRSVRWTSEESDACAISNEARTTNCSRLAPPPSRFLCVSESFVTRPRTRAINVSERSNGWYDVNSPLPSQFRFIGLLRHDPPETRFVNSLVETRLTPVSSCWPPSSYLFSFRDYAYPFQVSEDSLFVLSCIIYSKFLEQIRLY